jgi:hypothetical protein
LAGEAAGAWPLVERAPPRVPARVLLRTVVRLDGWRRLTVVRVRLRIATDGRLRLLTVTRLVVVGSEMTRRFFLITVRRGGSATTTRARLLRLITTSSGAETPLRTTVRPPAARERTVVRVPVRERTVVLPRSERAATVARLRALVRALPCLPAAVLMPVSALAPALSACCCPGL